MDAATSDFKAVCMEQNSLFELDFAQAGAALTQSIDAALCTTDFSQRARKSRNETGSSVLSPFAVQAYTLVQKIAERFGLKSSVDQLKNAVFEVGETELIMAVQACKPLELERTMRKELEIAKQVEDGVALELQFFGAKKMTPRILMEAVVAGLGLRGSQWVGAAAVQLEIDRAVRAVDEANRDKEEGEEDEDENSCQPNDQDDEEEESFSQRDDLLMRCEKAGGHFASLFTTARAPLVYFHSMREFLAFKGGRGNHTERLSAAKTFAGKDVQLLLLILALDEKNKADDVHMEKVLFELIDKDNCYLRSKGAEMIKINPGPTGFTTTTTDGQAVLCADRDFKVPERMKKIFGGVTNGQNRYVAMDDFEAHVSTDLFQNVLSEANLAKHGVQLEQCTPEELFEKELKPKMSTKICFLYVHAVQMPNEQIDHRSKDMVKGKRYAKAKVGGNERNLKKHKVDQAGTSEPETKKQNEKLDETQNKTRKKKQNKKQKRN